MDIEILIYDRTDELRDRGGFEAENWRRGDPVVVKEVPATWGSREGKARWIEVGNAESDWPGHFMILRVTGVPGTIEQVRAFFQSEEFRAAHVLDLNFTAPDPEDRFVKTHRRIYRLNVADLPPPLRRDLDADSFTIIQATRLRAIMRHKITDDPVPV